MWRLSCSAWFAFIRRNAALLALGARMPRCMLAWSGTIKTCFVLQSFHNHNLCDTFKGMQTLGKERKKEIHTQCAHYLRVARSNSAVHAARVFVGVFVAISSVEGRYHTVRQAQTWCKSVNLSKKRRKTKREGRKEIFAMLQCLLSRIYVTINQPTGLHEYLCNQVFVWRRRHGWAKVGTY